TPRSTVAARSSRSDSARNPTWPRLTPSSGVPDVRVRSAARSSVPSPPRTMTTSASSAAAALLGMTSTPVPPIAAASSSRTRTPIPAWPSRSMTSWALRIASGRPVCATTSTDLLLMLCPTPRRVTAYRRLDERPRRGRSLFGRPLYGPAKRRRSLRALRDGGGECGRVEPRGPFPQPQEVLHVARGARKRARGHPANPEAQRGGVLGHVPDRAGAQLRVADDAAGADPVLADLELRLHHDHEVGAGRRARAQRTEDQPQRDERQVADDQFRGRAVEHLRRQLADVHPLHDGDPLVGPQRPGELPVPDVDRVHAFGALPQQDVGEPAGGGARVQADAALHGWPAERLQRARQL